MKFLSISDAINKGKGKVAVRGWIYRERGSNKKSFLLLEIPVISFSVFCLMKNLKDNGMKSTNYKWNLV